MDMMNNFRPESHVDQQSRRHNLRHHSHIEDYDTTDNFRHMESNQGMNALDFTPIRGSRYENNVSYDPYLFQESSKMMEQGEESVVANLMNYNHSAKAGRDLHNSNTWGKVDSPQVCDWNNADYSSESGGIGRNTEQLIVGVGLGGDRNVKTNNIVDVDYCSNSLYQNTLQDVVSLATRGNKDTKMMSSVQQTGFSAGGNELVQPRTSSNQWMDRTCDRSDGGGGGGLRGNLIYNSQALSLSLSVPPSTNCSNPITGDCFNNIPESNCAKEAKKFISDSTHLVSPKCSQDMVEAASTFDHRAVGPLGPFTGYATVLASSKFLRPAAQLLENFCNVGSPKVVRFHQGFDDGVSSEHVEKGICGDSASSSTSFSRKDKSAKLLYMQYEVRRMYTWFHQQMQLVVSSFESVAGLRSAAPYFSLAVDKMSKHFNSLKSSISNQIRSLKKAIEDSSSPSSLSKLNFIDPAMQKQVVSGGNVPMFESQSHVWRPQRGLPERAVAVLRAWLFDHFLHPYPTDTDKHMLANRTGLTRNQVSNWFINARVRLWKPMIEEIHMLEGKELADSPDVNPGKTDKGSHPTDNPDGRQDMNRQLDCAGVTVSTSAGNRLNGDFWNLGKRPCPDYRTPATNMDGSVIGFSPYQGTGIGMEGLESVSLTLGLRQSVEAAQQQMQHFGGQTIHHFGR